MGQILLPPKINRKEPVRYMAGKAEYNYCIQYRQLGEGKPKVIKFVATDDVSSHRTITAIIKESIGFDRVIDIWMETISGWEKHGDKLRYYDMEYFRKNTK